MKWRNWKDRLQQCLGIILMVAGMFGTVNLLIMMVTRFEAYQSGASLFPVFEVLALLLVAGSLIWSGRRMAHLAESTMTYRNRVNHH